MPLAFPDCIGGSELNADGFPAGWGGGGGPTDEKYTLRPPPAGICVFLAQGDEFFGEALGFFCFGPGRADGFVGEEGGYEVAEQGLAVGGGAVEVAVFEGAAGHCGGGGLGRGKGIGGVSGLV